MGKIYAELARIQRDLKAPKNLYNKFGNYKYRNAEGILEAVKPMLNGLAMIVNDEPILIGDRFYIKATVTLTDGEESVSASAYAREDDQKKGMDGCQLTGACSSYARKYALNALLMIDDSKDSDDDSLSPKNPANDPKNEANSEPAFVPPPAENGNVITGQTVPPIPEPKKADPAPEQKKADPSPVQVFLLQAMKELRENRRISATKNNKLFAEQRNVLITAGLAPDKKLEEYTMDEATKLIDDMYNRFDPEGTELKCAAG